MFLVHCSSLSYIVNHIRQFRDRVSLHYDPSTLTCHIQSNLRNTFTCLTIPVKFAALVLVLSVCVRFGIVFLLVAIMISHGITLIPMNGKIIAFFYFCWLSVTDTFT